MDVNTTMTYGEQSFAALLREHRLAAGLTQAALAERANISTRAIQDLERALSQPHRETLMRLIGALASSPAQEAALLRAASPSPRRRYSASRDFDSGRADSREGSLHNLPTQLTSFIGRHRDLADLERVLNSARLVTLTGEGGVGKTRLALKVGESRAIHFPDGVRFVDLAPLKDPRLVAQTVASALFVRQEPGRPLITSLTEWLRGRDIMLIVDNCEHVIDSCAAVVQALLRQCPKLRVVATSREALEIAGEFTWTVAPLAVPSAARHASESEIASFESVQLFVHRAQAIQPDFRITGATEPVNPGETGRRANY